VAGTKVTRFDERRSRFDILAKRFGATSARIGPQRRASQCLADSHAAAASASCRALLRVFLSDPVKNAMVMEF
jgi:hypothetical protein